MDLVDLDNRFMHHPPVGQQQVLYEATRAAGKALAELITLSVPDSRERSLALTKVEEAIFWANAGIARRTTA